MSLPGGTIGILNPREGLAHFQIARHEPASDLLDFVDRHWIVRWDRTGLPPYEQELLPAPSCHLALRDGASGVRGIGTRRSWPGWRESRRLVS